jgi:hypothetical protein
MVAIGLIVWLGKAASSRGRRFVGNNAGLWFFALILVGAPMIGSGLYTPARTHSAVAVILLLPALAGGWSVLRRLPCRTLRGGILLATVLPWTLLARTIVTETVIEPISREFHDTRESIRREITEIPRSLTLVLPPLAWSNTQLRPAFEYRATTLHVDWLTEAMLRLMVAEHLGIKAGDPGQAFLLRLMPIVIQRPPYDEVIYTWGPTLKLPAGGGTTEGPRIRPDSTGPFESISLAPFGTVEKHASGWFHLPTLGHVRPNSKSEEWLQHPTLGAIRILSWNDDGFYLYSQFFGRVTGYRAHWPWVRLFDHDRRDLHLDHFHATLGDPEGYAAEFLQMIENAPNAAEAQSEE